MIGQDTGTQGGHGVKREPEMGVTHEQAGNAGPGPQEPLREGTEQGADSCLRVPAPRPPHEARGSQGVSGR